MLQKSIRVRKAFCLGSVIWLAFSSWAQYGGQSSYEFLNIPNNARLAALGGVNTSLADHDINFFFSNPALAGDSLAGWASASYLAYVGNIGQASFAYAAPFKRIGTVLFGVQHISYGEIEGFDATGAPAGTFQSGETALVIGMSHHLGSFRMGANVKAVFSNLAGFRSSAVMVDLGGVFIHPEHDFTVGLVIRNVGFVLSEYSETSDTEIPFDVQAGLTYKPEHMPLRFSVSVYNLVRPGELYDDPADQETEGTLDKVLGHFNFGAEVLLHRNVHLLAGYNFLRQKELRVETGGGGSGFNFGFSVNVRSFDFTFATSRYSVGNSNYTFTLATNLERMIFKKRTL